MFEVITHGDGDKNKLFAYPRQLPHLSAYRQMMPARKSRFTCALASYEVLFIETVSSPELPAS
jgi:hypothetical protein